VRSVHDCGVRLRVGVILWLLSWVPYGVILDLSGVWLTLSWGIEILLGITGLALAGTEVADAIKANGWKRAPAVVWHAFRDGARVRPAT